MKSTKSKIVCGTDFSDNALQAATAAATIAAKVREPLVLVHVMELPGIEMVGRDFIEAAQARGEERLEEEAGRLRKLGAKVEVRFVVGSPYETLVEVARESGARLIVMASTRRSAPEKWLVGSVAERVTQSSPVPTLVVRDAAVVADWMSGKKPLRIFVAADLSSSSESALCWVKDFAKTAPCKITVGYVNWVPESNERLGVSGPVSFAENAKEVQTILERDMRGNVEKILGAGAAKVLVEPSWGRADTHLVEMAEREQADLFVVGSHQRKGPLRLFSESVSRGALHLAPMNVAVVPSTTVRSVDTPISFTKRVLVTTDFSALGNRAIPAAFSLLSCGGTVCLLHIVNPSSTGKNQTLRKLKGDLEALIPASTNEIGIKTEVQVIESRDPAEAIRQAAAKFGADVICIASHGRSGISKLLFGSVAAEVIAQSDRPLLVVRPPKG